MLTDFFVASSGDAQAICENASRHSTWPSFESNGLDNSVLAALWSAIDSSIDSSSLEGEMYLNFAAGKDGPWVFNFPTTFVESLATLPNESLLPVAERWVKQPEMAHAGWPGAAVVPAIKALKNVASIAVQKQQALLLLMCL